MKKNFNKEYVMTKEDNENFESSTKCQICDNTFVKGDVNTKVHKAHRGCNINISLNCNILIMFQIQKYFDAHLIIQEL